MDKHVTHSNDGVLKKKMKRRSFLKATGGVIGGATLATGGGFALKETKKTTAKKVLADNIEDYKIVRSTCPMECLHCNLTAYVKDGKIKKIQPTTGLKTRSEEHTSELQSRGHLVCRLLLEKKKK